jgi:signal transduction histidine kinase
MGHTTVEQFMKVGTVTTVPQNGQIRKFDTGATRDTEKGKFDYEGFLSPLVLYRYAEYMHAHQQQTDGSLRTSDNWQKGIPLDVYMKSGWRHFFDWWLEHRKFGSRDGLEVALCGLLFNVMGYLHETLKKRFNRECTDRASTKQFTKADDKLDDVLREAEAQAKQERYELRKRIAQEIQERQETQ